MERKTKIVAEDGRQDLTITREFDLPLELLFRAYVEPDIVAQWMGTKVTKMESRKHGSYAFETANAQGVVVFAASGVIHELIPDRQLTRTFEMDAAPFGAQLEFLTFESLTDDTSKLTMHIVYGSVEARDAQMRLPFAYGLNMAHDRLQGLLNRLKP